MNLKALLIASCTLALFGFTPVQDPAKLPGFGEPSLLKKSADGWATIRFRDLGITVDLPNWPTPAEMLWDEGDIDSIKAWAGYDFTSRKITGDVYVYESATDEPYPAEELKNQAVESYSDEERYIATKISERKLVLDGKTVLVLEADYLTGIDATHDRAFFWEDGKKSGLLRLTWWAEDDATCRKQADHIERSLKLTP